MWPCGVEGCSSFFQAFYPHTQKMNEKIPKDASFELFAFAYTTLLVISY